VAHATHHDAGHDDGHHHPHVDATELAPPDEPKTPLWLTALGGGLLVLLAIAWLATRPAQQTLSELTPPAETAAPEPAVPAPAPAPPPQPVAAPAPMPVPVPVPAPVASAKGAQKAAKPKHKKAEAAP
jgi:cell division protein FtsN